MKIRLFGKDLFEFHAKGGDLYAVPAYNQLKESKYLYDFKNTMNDGFSSGVLTSWTDTNNFVLGTSGTSITAQQLSGGGTIALTKAPTPAQRKELTPKKVYSLEML